MAWLLRMMLKMAWNLIYKVRDGLVIKKVILKMTWKYIKKLEMTWILRKWH